MLLKCQCQHAARKTVLKALLVVCSAIAGALIVIDNKWISKVTDVSDGNAMETITSRCLSNHSVRSSRIIDLKIEGSIGFTAEIKAYHDLNCLPEICAVKDSVAQRPVSSQDVYANCSEPRVPNIVHLVWLYGRPQSFTFRHLLSVLSMLRFIQPCCIMFWNNGSAPTGNYWNHFVANVTAHKIDIKMLKITAPNRIHGHVIAFPEHKTDIIRFQVLKHFGGIYMDLDVLIVNSLRPLRCYDYTLGRESKTALPGSLILSVSNSTFLNQVIDHYKHYSHVWAYNSVTYPATLAAKHPELIHVEERSINRPLYFPPEVELIFVPGRHLNWRENYAIHLWNHVSQKYIPKEGETAESIRSMNSTFGEIARMLYYGSSTAIPFR